MTAINININKEQLLTLGQAAARFPALDGKRPSPNTIWRWCRRGVRGVRLGYIRVGRKIITSPDAINRFVNELAAVDQAEYVLDSSPKPKVRNPSARQRSIDAAERECTAAGI